MNREEKKVMGVVATSHGLVHLYESVHLSFLKVDTLALGGTMATLALISGALGQYVAGHHSPIKNRLMFQRDCPIMFI